MKDRQPCLGSILRLDNMADLKNALRLMMLICFTAWWSYLLVASRIYITGPARQKCWLIRFAPAKHSTIGESEWVWSPPSAIIDQNLWKYLRPWGEQGWLSLTGSMKEESNANNIHKNQTDVHEFMLNNLNAHWKENSSTDKTTWVRVFLYR